MGNEEPIRKQKYYAELIDAKCMRWDILYDNGILQSKLFDTEEEVYDWVKTVDYIDSNCSWVMMCNIFDENDELYDIFYMYDIKIILD